MCRGGTDAEAIEARTYIEKSGYHALESCLIEKAAYRQAQNLGHSVTETRYKGLNERAEKLIQSLIDHIS